ncbi:hypothetical protein [Krasilnikovia sp. MM14-A1259]|uniref:hypothetical protein n=1 Tax=Krasilnikovia sp. MM14-A1259 TaxID=3373539 RepID=UPI003807A86F
MTPAGSSALQVALAVAFVILTAYAAGRVHQWHRQGFEREVAYRQGYDQASHTLFHLATRALPAAASESAAAEPEGDPLARYGWAPAS